jgi:RNA polymerase sigma-70 factor (ECF subfamily)
LFGKSKSTKNEQTEEAFRVLFDLFHDRLYRIAYYMTKDPHLSQDVVQETFLKAFRNMDNVKDGKIMGSWLAVIATNTAIDLLRDRKRRNEVSVGSEIDTIDEQQPHRLFIAEEAELTFELERVRQGLNEISPEHRQALILRYEAGLSYLEMAEMLDVTEGTIKSRIHRAKERLRSILQNDAQQKGKG